MAEVFDENDRDLALRLFSLDVTTSQRNVSAAFFSRLSEDQIDEECFQIFEENLEHTLLELLEALRLENDNVVEECIGILSFLSNLIRSEGGCLLSVILERLIRSKSIYVVRIIQEVCYRLYGYAAKTGDRHGEIINLIKPLEKAIYCAVDENNSYLPDAFTGVEIVMKTPEQLEYWINIYRDRLVAFYLVYFLKEDSSDSEHHPIPQRKKLAFQKFYKEICNSDLRTAFNLLRTIMNLASDQTYDSYSSNPLDIFDVMGARDSIEDLFSGLVLPVHAEGIKSFFEFMSNNIGDQEIISRLGVDDLELLLSIIEVPERIPAIMQTHPIVVGDLNGLGLFFFSDFFEDKANEIDSSEEALRLVKRLQEEIRPNALLVPIKNPDARIKQINRIEEKNLRLFRLRLQRVYKIVHNSLTGFSYSETKDILIEIILLLDKELAQFSNFLSASDFVEEDYPDSIPDVRINILIIEIAKILGLNDPNFSMTVIQVLKEIYNIIYSSNVMILDYDSVAKDHVKKASPLLSLIERLVGPHYEEA